MKEEMIKFNQDDVDKFIKEKQKEYFVVKFKDIEFIGDSIYFPTLGKEQRYYFINCKFSHITITSELKSTAFCSSRFIDCDFLDCLFFKINSKFSYFSNCLFENTKFLHVDISYTEFENIKFKESICFEDGIYIGCQFLNNIPNIIYTSNAIGLTSVCPQEGSFIGYKKAYYNRFIYGRLIEEPYIVKLLILEDAKRSSSTSRKCRCSKAKVLSITNLDGTKTCIKTVYSDYDEKFKYTVGEIVEVKNFDENRWHECAPGIHFWMDRIEAVEYNI